MHQLHKYMVLQDHFNFLISADIIKCFWKLFKSSNNIQVINLHNNMKGSDYHIETRVNMILFVPFVNKYSLRRFQYISLDSFNPFKDYKQVSQEFVYASGILNPSEIFI